MAYINRQWKRMVICGCTHGALADPDALKAVLKFKSQYKPHRVIHLGDSIDMAAFRTGAKDTKDETVSITTDLQHGLNFLKEYRPTDFIVGNHEARLWKLADHHNAVVSRAAQSVIDEIDTLMAKLKATYMKTYDINRSWLTIGDYRLIHGWLFNEQALRDHTEMFGNIIMAHTHKAGSVNGRRSDHPVGYCVGTLANIPAMAYANTRRATMAWSHGFVYGEFRDDKCHPQLCSAPPNTAGEWHLPL